MGWRAPERAEQGGPLLVADGILATTLIATSDGWRRAGSLRPGARVLTFDAGAQCVVQVQGVPFAGTPPGLSPLRVPCHALGNREEITLLPEQKILIAADVAEELYGDPFALIPARALEGWRGITPCSSPELSVAILLRFDRHQVIYGCGGVLLSCGCEPPAPHDWLAPSFSRYSLAQARHLIACLMAEETGAALRVAGQHMGGSDA